MTTVLRWINLGGVGVLALLCGIQWQRERTVNLEWNESEKARLRLVETLERRETELAAKGADLDEFRERLRVALEALNDQSQKLRTAETAVDRLEAQTERLGVSLTNWMDAVARRDDELTNAHERLTAVMKDRNEVVVRFNALSARHAKLVDQWNEQQRKLAAERGLENDGPAPATPERGGPGPKASNR